MYQKKRYLFNEVRKTRWLIYSALLLLLVVYNFIIDLVNDTSIQEAIADALVFIPTTSIGLLILLLCHRWIISASEMMNSYFKPRITNLKTTIILGFLLVSVLISLSVRSIWFFLMNDEDNEAFLNANFFLYLLIVTTTFGTIFLIENLLVKVITEQRLRSTISDIEYERNKFHQITLKKQLSPHFLFNSFSSLLGLIQKSPEKAEKFVIHLANIYRSSIHKDDELVITLQEEYANSDSYVQLMMMRYPDAIKVNVIGDMQTTDYYLPPLTLLSLIENAVKHNMFSVDSPLVISISRENDIITVSNSFNPVINKAKSNGGTGKENLAKQFELLEYPEPEYKIENNLFSVKIHLITVY